MSFEGASFKDYLDFVIGAFPAFEKAIDAYKKASVSATGATNVFKGSLAALGTVIKKHPILFAISAILAIIPLVTNVIDGLTVSAEEAIEAASELSSKLEEERQALDSNYKTIKSLEDEFKELSKGVSDYGTNISLSTDKYSRYQDILSLAVSMKDQSDDKIQIQLKEVLTKELGN